MLKKCGIVGTAAQITDRNVALAPRRRSAPTVPDCLGRGLCGGDFRLRSLLPGVVDGSALRAWNHLRDVAQKLFQAWNGRRAKFLAGHRDIDIEICGS